MPGDADEPRERRLDVLPLGPLPPGLAWEVVAGTSRRLPAPCRLLRPEAVETSLLEGRRQVDADRLLAALESRAPDDGTILVGLTGEDMGSPLFLYFFGRARLHGRACVVSVARLTPAFYGLPEDADLTVRRAVVEVLHEVGHVAGLAHCEMPECVMRVTRTVEDLDNRGSTWCAACAARLPPDLRPRPRDA